MTLVRVGQWSRLDLHLGHDNDRLSTVWPSALYRWWIVRGSSTAEAHGSAVRSRVKSEDRSTEDRFYIALMVILTRTGRPRFFVDTLVGSLFRVTGGCMSTRRAR